MNGLCQGCRVMRDDFEDINATCNHEGAKMRDPVDRDFSEHSRAVDAETARDVYLEGLEEEIQGDPELKTRLALLYAEDREASFFKWAAERLADERTPQWKGGWSKC